MATKNKGIASLDNVPFSKLKEIDGRIKRKRPKNDEPADKPDKPDKPERQSNKGKPKLSTYYSYKQMIYERAKEMTPKDQHHILKDAFASVTADPLPPADDPDDITDDLAMFPDESEYNPSVPPSGRMQFFERWNINVVPDSTKIYPTTLIIDLVKDRPYDWLPEVPEGTVTGSPFLFFNSQMVFNNLFMATGFATLMRRSTDTTQVFYEIKQLDLTQVVPYKQIIDWNATAVFKRPRQVSGVSDYFYQRAFAIKQLSRYKIQLWMSMDNNDWTTLQKIYNEQYADENPGDPTWEDKVPRQSDRRKYLLLADAVPDNIENQNGFNTSFKVFEQSLDSLVQLSANYESSPTGNTIGPFFNINQPTEQNEFESDPIKLIYDFTNDNTQPGLLVAKGGVEFTFKLTRSSNLCDYANDQLADDSSFTPRPDSADPLFNWFCVATPVNPLKIDLRCNTVELSQPNESFEQLFQIAPVSNWKVSFPDRLIIGDNQSDDIPDTFVSHENKMVTPKTKVKFGAMNKPCVIKHGVSAFGSHCEYRKTLPQVPTAFKLFNETIPVVFEKYVDTVMRKKNLLTTDQINELFKYLSKMSGVVMKDYQALARFALQPKTSNPVAKRVDQLKYKHMVQAFNQRVKRIVMVHPEPEDPPEDDPTPPHSPPPHSPPAPAHHDDD